MKTGLVLEGGGMRGIYTAGVLDVFMENNIVFDGVVGVSAGATHGCSYVAGQKGRNIRYFKDYCMDKRFMSVRNLILTGDFVSEKFCYHELPEKLEPYDFEAFKKSPMEFYVTCCNLETGKAENIRITDMKKEMDLIRASASLPYLSRIVDYNGKKYLDGGCADSIPARAFIEMGFKKTVVVLTRDETYVKQPGFTRFAKFVYWKYPNFVKTVTKRHEIYNQTVKDIVQMEKAGEIFVIRPSEELKIGRMERNVEELQKIYDIGRKDAENRLAALREWIG